MCFYIISLHLISALLEGQVQSSVELIKSIHQCSHEVKTINLMSLVTSVNTCFEVLCKTLECTASIVSLWLEEAEEAITMEANFPYFLAMTMRANDNKDWFRPDDRGDFKLVVVMLIHI